MRIIIFDAKDGRKEGMTLDEVERFCTMAREFGATGTERIKGMVTFGGKQYQLKVTLDREKPELS